MSGKGILRATTLLFPLVSCLAGCASQAGVEGIKAEGNARHVPLMIYDTSWNDPHPLSALTRGGVIGSNSVDTLYVRLVNTGDQSIEQAILTLASCGANGNSTDAGIVLLKGPFQPGKDYTVRHAKADGVTLETELSLEHDHMRITAVKIIAAGGAMKEYKNDVSNLMSGNISNFCSSSY